VNASGREIGLPKVDESGHAFTQAEFNFALFFALAIQAYESTLISEASRFDSFEG
jgi:hypothetical protein